MNYEYGKFKCPKCGNDKVSGFKEWAKRDEYVNGEVRSKWIFYEKEIKREWQCCACCLCCKNDEGEDECREECTDTLLCCRCNGEPIFAFWYHFIIIFYILFFFWFDLFSYLCCSKKTFGKISGENDIKLLPKEGKMWDEFSGLTANDMTRYYPGWTCSKCKYSSKTFLPFIPKKLSNTIKRNKEIEYYEDDGNEGHGNENTMTLREVAHIMEGVKNNERKEYISVIFLSQAPQINFSVPCKKTDKFKTVLAQFYEEYPELKNKNAYFLANGEVVDPNKSMAENHLKRGGQIIIEFI